jgi:nucleotide-binding universal stress UspA family protein
VTARLSGITMNEPLSTVSPARGARYVVGIDGSGPSKVALRWADFLAGIGGGVIEAVAVWQPMNGYTWSGGGMAPPPITWDPAIEAEKALVETVDEVFGAHRPIGLQLVVREGHPAKVLLEISAGAGMLIVGSRGHGGFSGLLLGSVSTACAEHATCPVLVLHGDATPHPSIEGPS